MAAGFLLMAAVMLFFEIWFRTEDTFKSLGYYRAEILYSTPVRSKSRSMTIHAKINSGQDFWLRTEFPHFYAVTDKDICIEVFEREDAEALKAALVAFDKCTLSTE